MYIGPPAQGIGAYGGVDNLALAVDDELIYARMESQNNRRRFHVVTSLTRNNARLDDQLFLSEDELSWESRPVVVDEHPELEPHTRSMLTLQTPVVQLSTVPPKTQGISRNRNTTPIHVEMPRCGVGRALGNGEPRFM